MPQNAIFISIYKHRKKKKKTKKKTTLYNQRIHERCVERQKRLLGFNLDAFGDFSLTTQSRCGWILYAVIVVWVCCVCLCTLDSVFSLSLAFIFLASCVYSVLVSFFSLHFQTALYFVHRIYTQRIYTIFSSKRNDKYSARVPLKNRFSSLILLIFIFFSFNMTFFFLSSLLCFIWSLSLFYIYISVFFSTFLKQSVWVFAWPYSFGFFITL